MLGLMQNRPLLISDLIEHAQRHHGDVEIVSRRVEGDIHRTTYREAAGRARQLANALDAQGVAQGTGSLRWPGTVTAISRCTSGSAAPVVCCTPSTPA